jgi:peptidoglycan-associated lipoprotein
LSEDNPLSRAFASVVALAVGLAFSVVGCAPEVREDDPAPSAIPARLPSSTPSALPPPVETYANRPWDNPGSPLYRKVVYFDYDSSEIRPEFVSLLEVHANYLASHPGTRVSLEGHTDERGAREYNLALGDLRAQTVERYLLAEGVPADQLGRVSFGEEKPAIPGHGEGPWSQNRRVELAY